MQKAQDCKYLLILSNSILCKCLIPTSTTSNIFFAVCIINPHAILHSYVTIVEANWRLAGDAYESCYVCSRIDYNRGK